MEKWTVAGQMDQLRSLPSVDEAVGWPEVAQILLPRPLKVAVIRGVLSSLRAKTRQDTPHDQPAATDLGETARILIATQLTALRENSLRRVVNATGVILHTNLGRAPLAPRAVKRLLEIGAGYSSLEYDLVSGERGNRLTMVRAELAALFAAPDALVVNNNAAAVFLAIRAFLKRRAPACEVVISRGELVEIGGSFRIPEVIAAAGAKLHEVGTTNRTHRKDYEAAISPAAALFLKVHPSNFQQAGFVAAVATSDLVELGRAHGIPVMEDLGSGTAFDFSTVGHTALAQEPEISTAFGAGVAALSFSADKLLGGPQAGVILGDAELVMDLKADPLYRALRLSKLDLAALEATLEIYLEGESATEIPVLRALLAVDEELAAAARRLRERLVEAGYAASVEKQFSEVGGGTLPALGLPTWVVKVDPSSVGQSAATLGRALRTARVPVIARITDGKILCDVRTLLPGEEEVLVKTFQEVLSKSLEQTRFSREEKRRSSL